ncbi:MAG: GldM family protein [Bacteroidota bacterium]
MTFRLLISLFLLLSLQGFGQNEFINSSLIFSKKKIIYIGFENKIIAESLRDTTGLRFTVTQGSIFKIKGDPFSFLLMPWRIGPDTVKAYRWNEFLFETVFESKSVPDPVPTIAGCGDGSVMWKKTILKHHQISIIYPDCYIFLPIYVTYCSATLQKKNGDTLFYSEVLTDGLFSKKLIKNIKRLEPGDMITFSNIKAGAPDGTARSLPPFTIIIKEE